MGTLPLHDFHHHLRAMLLKISVSDALLLPSPPEKSFAVAIELNEGGEPTQEKVGRSSFVFFFLQVFVFVGRNA